MSAPLATDRYESLVGALRSRFADEGLYGVFRFQVRRDRSVSLEGTRVESVGSSCTCGLGVQAFTRAGHTGFAAVDDPDERRAIVAADRAIAAARAAEAAGLEANPAVLCLPRSLGREVPDPAYPFDHMDVGRMRDEAAAFAGEVRAAAEGVHAATAFAVSRDEWRIARSDGSDVSFLISRGALRVGLTARRESDAAKVLIGDTGTSYELLLDGTRRAALVGRARCGAALARDLLGAPAHPAGSFPLLIDFALAKGLAHEAFGHAAESDGLDASILGRRGRFRAGERFGSDDISIVDESLVGDNAYQPFSGNGVPRDRALILDRGVLRDALTDAHTAGRAGTRLTGAARLSSFASVPIPRMSNIRIEVLDPWPVPEGKDFYDWRPEEVGRLLMESGDLPRLGRVLYLSGYKGGQVNPALGDFVFHSAALYELTPEGTRLFKPGIFSGRIEAALRSISRGFGPLRLDAAGTCGKAGQGVPSSGGSHHFLLLEAHDEVRIGGSS